MLEPWIFSTSFKTGKITLSYVFDLPPPGSQTETMYWLSVVRKSPPLEMAAVDAPRVDGPHKEDVKDISAEVISGFGQLLAPSKIFIQSQIFCGKMFLKSNFVLKDLRYILKQSSSETKKQDILIPDAVLLGFKF